MESLPIIFFIVLVVFVTVLMFRNVNFFHVHWKYLLCVFMVITLFYLPLCIMYKKVIMIVSGIEIYFLNVYFFLHLY